MRMSSRSMAVVGVAAGLSAVGAVAAASIPDASNTIHGCYLNTGGNLRVIDTSAPGAGCDGAGETALTWNQTGPQGPAGPKGDPGPAGAKGDPGAGVIAYRTSPDQRGVYGKEPGFDKSRDHVATRLDLPPGTYAVFGHWRIDTPGAICIMLLREGSAPLSGSIYENLSTRGNGTVQDESTWGVPETSRYGGTTEHGEAAVQGTLPAGGYVLVRCESSDGDAVTPATALRATITALRVTSAVTADENGGTANATPPPPKSVTLKAPLKGTTAISGGTQSQLLKIASQGVKAPTRQQRARTVLLSTGGATVAEIAATVGISPTQVRRVVGAFAKRGLAGIR